MVSITARIDTEILSTRYICDTKQIMMVKEAMKYMQRAGASHTGECTPVFFLLVK